jgi:hypothetical protein
MSSATEGKQLIADPPIFPNHNGGFNSAGNPRVH